MVEFINKVHLGDCLEVLKGFPDNSVDSVVTDPPYGISFMNKKWDYDVPSIQIWKEVLRVLKPGGHALVACGTRTQHRMAVNLEDAGFEIRDTIEYLYDTNEPFQELCKVLIPEHLKLLVKALGNDCIVTWAYGSGFPKSLNISKAIDRAAGVEREIVGKQIKGSSPLPGNHDGKWNDGQADGEFDITVPATEEAKKWDGWGTALKPAIELWTLCRKPLAESSVAANVLKYGTGGLNLDACRVGSEVIPEQKSGNTSLMGGLSGKAEQGGYMTPEREGRWPSNLVHDGSEAVTELFPETNKQAPCQSDNKSGWQSDYVGGKVAKAVERKLYLDENNGGSAARFFYCAKASKTERGRKNTHTTVKPVGLMEYLVKLVTPSGGIVLDPFTGSGSTLVAAKIKGFQFIGIEREENYREIAEKRVAEVDTEKDFFDITDSLEEVEKEAPETDCFELLDKLDL